MITSCLDWQAHDRLLGQLSAMASIGLSGVLSSGVPGAGAFPGSNPEDRVQAALSE